MVLVSIFFAFITPFQTGYASRQSALYRDGQINLGNFKQNPGKYLSVEIIASFLVADVKLDCAFKCVGETRCFSFNIATYPDSKVLYQCEMLATDKYRAKNMLQTNATFHHYSPLVSRVSFLVL